MNKPLKKILTASAALLMFVSAGASINNTNANAKHRRHYRTHRVYRRRHARRHVRRYHESGANWYFHNAYKLKRRYLHRNANFTKGWIDADTINGREMQYDGMTDRSSNCFPQLSSTRAGHGRYGEGWVVSAYYQWNDSRGHLLNSRRSNRMRNLNNIIHNYNSGINYLQSGAQVNSESNDIYLSKHGHWFADQGDNY